MHACITISRFIEPVLDRSVSGSGFTEYLKATYCGCFQIFCETGTRNRVVQNQLYKPTIIIITVMFKVA